MQNYVSLPLEKVQELLTQSVDGVGDEVTALEERIDGLKDEMSSLKAALYGRFGKSINLEA